MFNKLALKTKLIGGFLVVAMMVLIVGTIGWLGINGIIAKNTTVARTSPLVDAAMEMKISVARDMVGIMDILAAEDEANLSTVWAEHEEQVTEFDTYADGILKGAKTDGGMIYPAESEELKNIVLKANQFHHSEFQPRLQKLRALKLEEFATGNAVNEAMGTMETTADAVASGCENLEVYLASQLDERRENGTPIEELMDNDLLWIDLSMESKITILNSRISIEEYVQYGELAQLDAAKKEYQATIVEFDQLIGNLLSGGQFDGQTVNAAHDPQAVAAIKKLDSLHEQFQTATNTLMSSQKRLLEIQSEMGRLDVEADNIGLKMFTLMTDIEVSAKNEIATVQEEARSEAQAANFQGLVGMTVGLILAISLGFFLTISITKPINHIIESLQQGAEQVATASSQVASSSQAMAEGASEQASSLEETSASLEMMSSMARESAEKTSEANQQSSDVRTKAEQGQSAMSNLDTAMNKIKDSSDKTAKIIKTIDEIAFQTNLLALNAAVEAARAGDAGKGFAVVAEEVRNLAQRSAEAAKDTTSLIDESQENSVLGVNATREVAETLGHVVDGINMVSTLVKDVSSNTDSQAKNVNEINTAVSQMDQLTQGNAASAEESASAAEEMSAQAAEMQKLVQDLVTVVSGAGAVKKHSVTQFNAGSPETFNQGPARQRGASHNKNKSFDEVIPLDDGSLIEV